MQHFPETRAVESRWGRRARWAALTAVVGAAVGISMMVGKAQALSSVAAVESVKTSIPIKSSSTSLGSVSLSAGNSYVVLAKLNLRSTASFPVSVECQLGAPGDAPDFENASFGSVKGTGIENLSFMAVSAQFNQGAPAALGSATLSCQATNPAADSLVIAHDARIVMIPVDTVSNNLGTLSRPGQ